MFTRGAIIRHGWASLLAALLVPASEAALPPEAVKVDREVSAFVKRLRSTELQKLAANQGKLLTSGTSPLAQRHATLFFYDLRAKEVLMAALALEDGVARQTVLREGMDLFTVDDLPRLYRLAISHPKLPKTADDLEHETFMELLAREAFVRGISEHAAKLVGVKGPPFPGLLTADDVGPLTTTQSSLRHWWLKVLKEAKAKEDRETKAPSPSRIAPILRAIDKHIRKE